MMAATKRRRADGKLRPWAARQYEARSEKQREERREWLARFAPGARKRFFLLADTEQAVWLRASAEKLGVSQEDAALILERIAGEKRWMKLRIADGMVVGIAPPKAKRPR